MTTILLPPEIETPLTAEARRRGVTLERLVLDALREQFTEASEAAGQTFGATLFDRLADQIGIVNGAAEALSEQCGHPFTESLVEKQQAGRL